MAEYTESEKRVVLAKIRTYNPDMPMPMLDQAIRKMGWGEVVKAVNAALNAPTNKKAVGAKERGGASTPIDPFWRTAVKGIEIDVDEAIAVLSREMGIPQALVDAMRRKLGRDELYNVLVAANGGAVRFEVTR